MRQEFKVLLEIKYVFSSLSILVKSTIGREVGVFYSVKSNDINSKYKSQLITDIISCPSCSVIFLLVYKLILSVHRILKKFRY